MEEKKFCSALENIMQADNQVVIPPRLLPADATATARRMRISPSTLPDWMVFVSDVLGRRKSMVDCLYLERSLLSQSETARAV